MILDSRESSQEILDCLKLLRMTATRTVYTGLVWASVRTNWNL